MGVDRFQPDRERLVSLKSSNPSLSPVVFESPGEGRPQNNSGFTRSSTGLPSGTRDLVGEGRTYQTGFGPNPRRRENTQGKDRLRRDLMSSTNIPSACPSRTPLEEVDTGVFDDVIKVHSKKRDDSYRKR